ncbi:hypothetical protein BDW69DRAFT_130872 [Aspergillus filifer]
MTPLPSTSSLPIMPDHHACVHPDSIPVPGKPLTGRQLYYLSSLHRSRAASARSQAFKLETRIAALNTEMRQLKHDLKKQVDKAEQAIDKAERFFEEAGRVSHEERVGK